MMCAYSHPVTEIDPNRGTKKRLPSLRDPDTGLWRLTYALGLAALLAVGGLVGMWFAALASIGMPRLPHGGTLQLKDTVSVAQLVFASVAGAGALVALVVAYRRQRLAESTTAEARAQWETTSAHDRARLLNERFTSSASQLGDVNAAVRLAGVHAMAGLADDWAENRQTCVDVLCAYLRMPYTPDPGESAAEPDRLAFQGNREVRHTAIRVIASHLRRDAQVSWQGLNLDFSGVEFDGGDFNAVVFSGGRADFRRANFAGKWRIDFSGSTFSGGLVDFTGAAFSDGQVSFEKAEFAGSQVSFESALFTGGTVEFTAASFSGGIVEFTAASFSGGTVRFDRAKFSDPGKVTFWRAKFSDGQVSFEKAEFAGGRVTFGGAEFSGGRVSFNGADFSGGLVSFVIADDGPWVAADDAAFSGGQVIFDYVGSWSRPPEFPWDGAPPAGVNVRAEVLFWRTM
jgi:uncharacterized protein YjbI with pentapeptide repeats